MAVRVEYDRVCKALEAAVPRLTGEIRSAPDPNATAVGHWSVRDLSAHLADVFTRYTKLLRGGGIIAPNVEALVAINEEGVKERPSSDISVFADEVDAASTVIVSLLRAADPDSTVRWSDGIVVPTSAIAGLALGECLVHGFDLAQAAGRPWHIDADDVGLLVLGVAPFLPHYTFPDATRGFTAVYELRLRGGPRLRLAFVNGELTVSEPDGGRVDCYISADPIAYLLVGYGRKNQWTAALTGKLMSYGRKPWLGLKLASLLRNP